MLLPALNRFLTYSQDLPGQCAQRFASTQTIDDRPLNCRNDARRNVRDIVGTEVFAGRRPQRSSGHTAISLRTISADSDLPLVGETGTFMDIVECVVWSRGVNADYRCELVGRLVRISLSNYVGWLEPTQDTWCKGVRIEREGQLFSQPGNASDDWSVAWSQDMQVAYEAAAPVYPDEMLTAIVTTRPGSSGELIISGATSVIPEGRQLATVAFTVRLTQGGTIQTSWSGPAYQTATALGVTGLNVEASVADLEPTGWIDLLITDNFGNQHSSGVAYG
jgi:hypothetical protein